MKECIICENKNDCTSVEHIVSESFGNKNYVMDKGRICNDCNNRFSKFEAKALSNSIFVIERARLGIKSKKGKTAKGQIGELKVEGNKDFIKDFITVNGLSKENLKDFDPDTQQGGLITKAFDKSEAATSKLLLKMGIESIFTSQRKVFNNNEFSELKDYLQTTSNNDWPFIATDKNIGSFNDIPKFTPKYELNKKKIVLKYSQENKDTLLFKFKFGGVTLVINLISRDIAWIKDYIEKGNDFQIYPEHISQKIIKSSK